MEMQKKPNFIIRYIDIILFFMMLIAYRVFYAGKVPDDVFTVSFPFIFYIGFLLIKYSKLEAEIQTLKSKIYSDK